jgi:GT2 family glycosyltransferase
MNSDVAAVGCKVGTMKNHRITDSVRAIGIKHRRDFVNISKYEMDRGQYYDPPITPFSVCGAAMLVRKNAFDLVGGFVSRFFAYVEDAHLSWGLRLRSSKLAYEPVAKVAHHYASRKIPPYFENYDYHWGFASFRNKTVLDIGDDYGSTASYFL